MKEYLQIQKPVLGYTYEFELNQLGLMSECLDAHGFAVIKDVLSEKLIDLLRQAVFTGCGFTDGTDAKRALKFADSKGHLAWVESSSSAWELLEYEPFMGVHRHLTGTDRLTINRSAAIMRMPGFKGGGWHTDWYGFSNQPPQTTGDVLNRGLWPSGTWFYLTGSRPEHGGLCVIEDSHLEGWKGPRGFKLTKDRKSFSRTGEEENGYDGFDVPGLVPLFTSPADMIVFAHRTYHAPFPNQIDDIRLSCSISFRDRDHKIEMPWKMPETGKQFLEDLPPHLHRYTHGYTSIDTDWQAEKDRK